MNLQRRKAIAEAMVAIHAVINIGALEGFVEAIREVRDDEQEAFDNMSEGSQESERGEKMNTAIGCLEDMISAVEEAIEKLGELDDLANTAME